MTGRYLSKQIDAEMTDILDTIFFKCIDLNGNVVISIKI